MTEKNIRAVIDRFLINIGRGERQKETSNSITSIINKNNPSKLEKLSWDSKQKLLNVYLKMYLKKK